MKKLLTQCALAVFAATSAQAFETPCDDAGCTVTGDAVGQYHLALPDEWSPPVDAPQKVLVFFHGHGGSGAGLMRNKGLIRQFTDKGYVVIAPDGETVPGTSSTGWPARTGLANARDDVAFSEAVLADASKKLGDVEFDILMGGFSAGGSMAWMFACYSAVPITAVVSVSGGLRRPIPENLCPAGPQRLLQIHGFTDRQVPLEGRGIGNWHQGDVFEGLSVLRNTNQCLSRPDSFDMSDAFWCRNWTSCESGAPVRMCLHSGGHGLPKGWVAEALRWHEESNGA